MGSTIQQRKSHFQHIKRHLEGNRLSRGDRVLTRQSRWIACRHQLSSMGNGVTHLGHQFTETSLSIVTNKFSTMNISYRSTANQFTGCRVVVRGPPRFSNRGTDTPMRPGGRTESMVMPEHQTQIDIHPPTITHVFGRNNMTFCMRMRHSLRELDGVFAVFSRAFIWIRRDVCDPARILAIGNFDTNNDISSNMVGGRTLCHLNLDRVITRFCRLQQLGVHRNRHANMVPVFHLLGELGVRPHRLVIGKTSDHAV